MFSRKSKYSIVSDVGGTKTVIAVMDNSTNKILLRRNYITSEITNYTDVLHQFMMMPECKKYKILDAAIAAAGQTNHDRTKVQLTNYNLTIITDNILVRTPLKRVLLLNDFEAAGFGLDLLKSEQYLELTNFGRRAGDTIAVIGAGTGLGTSIVPIISGKHIPLPSEGGHVDFPLDTTSQTDLKLITYLRQKKLYNDAEDIVSGKGILNIYNFLLTQKIKHNPKYNKAIMKVSDKEKPALISKYALEDRDLLCIKTMELFIKYYARIARNLAISSMSSELVIAGGIAPKISSAMQDVFLEEFTKHQNPRIHKMLELMSVIIIMDTDIELYGALNALKL
jgi:glucokinase